VLNIAICFFTYIVRRLFESEEFITWVSKYQYATFETTKNDETIMG